MVKWLLGNGELSAYQGNRTDQFRKMAAKTSKVTSVTMELPFWKKMPAMAGRRASPRGEECQCDSSRLSLSFDTRGRNRSSVEDRMELRASDIESDRVELRRSSPAEREGMSVMISFP